MSEGLSSFQGASGVLLSGAQRPTVFEITPEGAVTTRGYTVDEVVLLLEAYREHTKQLVVMMQEVQSGADSVRWSPLGPEDV